MRAVAVWEIPLLADDTQLEACRQMLDCHELSRLARFPTADLRRRFAVSHAATRLILASYLQTAPTNVTYQLGQWGKPHLVGSSDIHHNLTHSGEVALLAISPDQPVGVDVETSRTTVPALALADRFFLPSEARAVAIARPESQAPWFLRLWTRKEAAGKASGLPLDQALKFAVGAGEGCFLVQPMSPVAGGSRMVSDIGCGSTYVAAVSMLGDAPFEVHQFQWSLADLVPAISDDKLGHLAQVG